MVKPRKARLPAPAAEFMLGERLRYFRTQRKLSQSQLAQGAKLSQSTIAQIESGRKDPSVQTLRKIARVLDTELATIFAGPETFVFDLPRLRRKYNHADKLTPHLYKALGLVVKFARDIKYL